MELFWKRAEKHENEPDERSETAGRAAAQFELVQIETLPQALAELDNAISTRKEGARDPKSALFFADEADVREQSELPEQIDVESLVERLTDRRSRVKRGLVSWMWLASAPIFALWLSASLLSGDLQWAPLCLFALATARAFTVQAARQDQDRIALRNAHLDNRWIAPLCEALEWPDRRVRGVAARLLAQFLPRLQAGDAPLLQDEHRTCLYRRLAWNEARKDPDLAFAVLQSLPHIGTEAAMPYVEKLARWPAFTREGRRVRGMARTTLAGLERRIASVRAQEAVAGANADRSAAGIALLPNGLEGQLSEAEREEISAMNALVDSRMAEIEEGMRKLREPGMRNGFLIASWAIIFPYFAVQTILQLREAHWMLGVSSAIAAVGCTQLYRWTLTAEHRRLARKLSKVEDVRCIGRLAEALDWPDAGLRNIAIGALTRLLKRVKATDKVLAMPRQRANLHRLLTLPNARHHEEFLTSILQALGQVGDADSVPFVQNLANAQPTSAQQRRVCDAAKDCLDYLKVRAELNRSSQTLLRASSVNAAPSDMLVRPADARAATDPSQLLRADSGAPLG